MTERTSAAISFTIPERPYNASIRHKPSFSSFSFEPAFWNDFFGNTSDPNNLTFGLIDLIVQHGGQPHIRPGGITMDSMVFNEPASEVVRHTSPSGGIYYTTIGPDFYESWSLFPNVTKFVSTLNLGNDSLQIAVDEAKASVKYQAERIAFFELGNEPNNYKTTRCDNSTSGYVQQWKNWTGTIDAAVNAESPAVFPHERWIASSATTDDTPLHVRPNDLIPAGIDSQGNIAAYSIHSYPFSTCDPTRNALATLPNILNHTVLLEYAVTGLYPSGKAALDSGSKWVVGEFNSVSCSGKPNVTDTFAQALWVIDSELIYATLNASACFLHQGATLVFQSSDQVNTAGENGAPGFSTYDFVYPRSGQLRGPARVLPSFAGQMFLAESFATDGIRVKMLDAPAGVDADYFSGYAFYEAEYLSHAVFVNLKPYYENSSSDYTVELDLKDEIGRCGGGATVKRLTAPYVDTKTNEDVKWAGQSFQNGTANGKVTVERVAEDSIVSVRGSEAVLVNFKKSSWGHGQWGGW